ncbi:hypothetical protein IWQ56_002192, partial [Coemansia nantahalensis]
MAPAKGPAICSRSELAKLQDPSLVRAEAFVGGEWVAASSGRRFDVTDPATLETVGSVPDMDAGDVRRAIDVASEAFSSWKTTTARQRSVLLRRWYELMVANKDDLARLVTLECGKPLVQAVEEVYYAASFVEWNAEEAKRMEGDVLQSPTGDTRILVMKQPVGVVGAITPYNFPCAMITRKAAALAAGCTLVARPAYETPLSALALAELARRAGFPPGVFNVVTCAAANTPEVGLELTTNPLVRKITFTGSTTVGKLLTRQASSTMKKISMELGGNAPFIVFEDGDVDKAVGDLVVAKFRNSGQTCICANRVYVHESVYDSFVAKFAALVREKMRVGHGL